MNFKAGKSPRIFRKTGDFQHYGGDRELLQQGHLALFQIGTAVHPVQVYTAGNLFAGLIAAVPDQGITPGGLIAVHQLAHPLPQNVENFDGNPLRRWQFIGNRGGRVKGIGVILLQGKALRQRGWPGNAG